MSLVPEFIIQQMLVRGLRKIREDSRYISAIFRNLAQPDVQALIEYFRENSIELSLNWPDKELELPAIVVLLKSESESGTALNNMLLDNRAIRELGSIFDRDELEGDAIVLGSGTTGYLNEYPKVYLEPTLAIGGSQDSIIIQPGFTNFYDPFEKESFAIIVDGTGAGQKRGVVGIRPSNEFTNVKVSPNWDIEPDNTSIVKIIGGIGSGFTGEPSKIFSSNDVLEQKGSIFKTAYQLLIIGQDPEITIFLYTIVKALFFIEQGFLLKQGLINFSLSGSDLSPRSDLVPTLAYQRSLNIDFDYSFEVLKPVDEETIQLDKSNLDVVVSTHETINDATTLEIIGLRSKLF